MKALTGSAPGAVRGFKTRKDFDAWLEKNHKTSPALWVRMARKGSGIKSITYAEGVEVALCYGWIDAQKLPESETTWLQRFVPRRPRSIWSKVNREKALALIANGQMTPAGLVEIERAKTDGRWEAAYDSQAGASVPPDFEEALERHPKAKAFFKTISAANRYAITWRLQTAKRAETRAKRMRSFIEMLEKGETLH
ncbi:MAG TPA: YdeI/OmpD-associated family protein [Gemmatimonadaceae bacterium]